MKNGIKFLFIFFIFLVSFNIFANGSVLKGENISFVKKIPFEKLPENIEEDRKNGTMKYLKNQQCLISTYRTFYKNSSLSHINIYANCVEVDPGKKVNRDSPEISENTDTKTIHVLGSAVAKKLLNDLKNGKSTFFGDKQAYYKPSHQNYKKNEYFYLK